MNKQDNSKIKTKKAAMEAINDWIDSNWKHFVFREYDYNSRIHSWDLQDQMYEALKLCRKFEIPYDQEAIEMAILERAAKQYDTTPQELIAKGAQDKFFSTAVIGLLMTIDEKGKRNDFGSGIFVDWKSSDMEC